MIKTITFDQNGKVLGTTKPYQGGTVTQGNWSQVARDLVAIGWGTLNPNEYCKQLVVDEDGIKMVIGQKTKV